MGRYKDVHECHQASEMAVINSVFIFSVAYQTMHLFSYVVIINRKFMESNPTHSLHLEWWKGNWGPESELSLTDN